MFVVFVPKLLESGFSAATIFLCLPVLTALLQDGELDLVPQLSLCLALASFGKFVSCRNNVYRFAIFHLTLYSLPPLLRAY